MRFKTLDSWLNWQQTLNPKTIELGLDRVRQVYDRLKLEKIAKTVITVAGTNGKGSTVAYYETWFKNSGFKVASYTSPHLIRYNERIKLNLEPVSDEKLLEAFAAVDEARGELLLTYFEFGTLAALYIFSGFKADVVILEVGLGGRLDATNIIDADLAHITPIGLDHQDWLGSTVEEIAIEKAGILRQNRLAVCNMTEVPASLFKAINDRQNQCSMLARDYRYEVLPQGEVQWASENLTVNVKPILPGKHQALNISGVLAGLELLGFLKSRSESEISRAFDGVSCAGRLQKIENPYSINLWVDVGHNEDAAKVLNSAIRDLNIQGRVFLLLGMLSDKNPQSFVSKLMPIVDEWWVLGLHCDRGLSAEELSDKIKHIVPVAKLFDSAENCLEEAVLCLSNQDILLACGSFMTVEAILSELLT